MRFSIKLIVLSNPRFRKACLFVYFCKFAPSKPTYPLENNFVIIFKCCEPCPMRMVLDHFWERHFSILTLLNIIIIARDDLDISLFLHIINTWKPRHEYCSTEIPQVTVNCASYAFQRPVSCVLWLDGSLLIWCAHQQHISVPDILAH